MSSFDRLIDRLPGLYRPDPEDDSLLRRTLATIGAALDVYGGDMAAIMQAHWYTTADQAAFQPYASLRRLRAGLPVLRAGQLLDVRDPAKLAVALKGDSPLAVALRQNFTAAALASLNKAASTPVEDLRRALVAALERVARGPSLYTPERFAGLDLAPELEALAVELGPLPSAPQLNRDLLLGVFPNLLALPVADHPYLIDLARLGALAGVSPRTLPASLRESVEAYRLRLARVVAVYRNGLGTLPALRDMVEALLPVALDRPAEERDRPFLVELQPDLSGLVRAAPTLGAPDRIVGPLMRWSLDHQGVRAVLPTLYIQGVAPVPGQIDATQRPLIERLPDAHHPLPLGLAYDDVLAPDECLRLRPGYACWLGTENGPRRARSLPGDGPANPTAPGPWNPVSGAPPGRVTAFCQGPDLVLWVAVEEAAVGQLWRHDGQNWLNALGQQAQIRCLAVQGYELLIGTDAGLLRMHLFPVAPEPFVAQQVAELAGLRINALLQEAEGWIIACQFGLVRWNRAVGTATPFGLHRDLGSELLCHALHRDASGHLYVGCELGLFQYQPGPNHWYWFAGGSHSESEPDWVRFGGLLPEGEKVFLPPVLAVLRGEDASLWLGTSAGIARYLARAVRGTTYETVLEAFPDLSRGPVPAVAADPRGQTWFATERGPLRFDGRDWWQPRSDGWRQLGRAAQRYDGQPRPRGAWRYRLDHWESFGTGWASDAPALRTTNRAAATALIWIGLAHGDRGQWDGTTFTPVAAVAANKLRVRCKPTPDRSLDGGIAAMPSVSPGTSHWRYLRLLDVEPSPPLPGTGPYWNPEGRLVLPAADELPWEGRWSLPDPPPASVFERAVFAFNPAARVWFSFPHQEPLTVLVRLGTYRPDEILDDALIQVVWEGIERVRPVGVRVLLAVEEKIVRGI